MSGVLVTEGTIDDVPVFPDSSLVPGGPREYVIGFPLS